MVRGNCRVREGKSQLGVVWVHVDNAGVCGISRRSSNGRKRRDVHIVGKIVSHKLELTVHQPCGSSNASFHKYCGLSVVHDGDGIDRVAVVQDGLEVGPVGARIRLPLAGDQRPWDEVSARCCNAGISLSNVRVLNNKRCSLVGVCCHGR